MKEFVLVFRLDNLASFTPTPEQMQERLQWLADLASASKLADRGHTLLPAGESAKTIHADGSIIDGPYANGSAFVSGYMIMRAKNINEAMALAKTNPIFKIGGSIEVREVLKRPATN